MKYPPARSHETGTFGQDADVLVIDVAVLVLERATNDGDAVRCLRDRIVLLYAADGGGVQIVRECFGCGLADLGERRVDGHQ